MADEESKELFTDGHDFAYKIVGLAIILASIGTVFERNGWSDFFNTTRDGQEQNIDIENTLLSSNLKLGEYIVNIDDVIVRELPAGRPLGRQADNVKGRLIEGPTESRGVTWWRVDYEKAPDGWVEGDLLSNKLKFFTLLNIVPITLSFLTPIFIIVTIIFLILIFIVKMKAKELYKLEKKKKEVKEEHKIIEEEHSSHEEDELPIPNLPIGEKPAVQKPSNRRWSNIQSLMNSYNNNDWKQAIIEADTILEEMLMKMGYKGNGVGEMLKQIEHSDFTTLNQAWEAHKVRNRVAHASADFILSKDEAERVIELYKEVFEEFFYI